MVTEAAREIGNDVASVLPAALEFYLDLHRHPELSGAEQRTAASVTAALTTAGFSTVTAVGGHGVVGILRNGDGPAVAIRAELDALPVREGTGLAYASTTVSTLDDGRAEPVMHACGHDMHLACANTAAQLLARHADRWRGTLMVIGQPAEETLTGARAMLDDGLYNRCGRPDVVLAQHLAPYPAGLVAHSAGPATAASASVRVIVHGRGGHAATPQAVISPIELAAAIVSQLGQIGADAARQGTALVCTVAALNAGGRFNVVPDRAELLLTLRAFTDDAIADALDRVRDIASAVTSAAGAPREPDVSVAASSPAVVSDSLLAAGIRDVHIGLLGRDRVIWSPPSMATDDVSWFGPAGQSVYGGAPVPTVYWMLGSTAARQWNAAPGRSTVEKLAGVPANHSPEFAPDPVITLRTGTVALVGAVLSSFATLGSVATTGA